MNVNDVIKSLKPFADFSDLFGRGFGGVPNRGENFYTKTFSVNGEEKIISLNVEDFYAAKAAHDFLVAMQSGGPEKEPTKEPTKVVNPNPTPEEIANATKLGGQPPHGDQKSEPQKPHDEDKGATETKAKVGDEAKAEIAAAKKGK